MFFKSRVKEIDLNTLQDWLNADTPVTIIDVRMAQDFKAWHIAEATHVDPNQDLVDFDPEPNQPVVAVCYAGVTSKRVVRYLESKGIDSYSLKGGMQSWSLAWNQAEVPLSTSAAKVIQVRRTGKGCLSYLIGSGSSALVIDASVDPQIYLDLAHQQGWTIETVLETHIHADHITRGRELANQTNARYLLPETNRTQFEHEAIKDGDTITVGTSTLTARHTPGHTFETTSYLLDNEILFSSDTLFPTSIGRADLKTNHAELIERAHAQYHTLQKLKSLDPNLIIAACHTSEPVAFQSTAICATLGEALSANQSLLTQPIDEFTKNLIGKIPETPPNHLQIIQLNEHGQMPRGDITRLEAGANNCAIN